jgi:hypothetical protein
MDWHNGLTRLLRQNTGKSCPHGGQAMKRYFFDFGTQGRSMYDYKGHEFATPEAAYQLAALIALDLEIDGEWVGWAVAVRSPEGDKIFSIPVRNAELVDL